MHRKIWGCALSVVLVALMVTGWNVQAGTSTNRSVKLLFAHSLACGHCAYQRPIIRQFEARHPEVAVKWVRYADLNQHERKLIEGTTGHPVMVFHSGNHIRQVQGETSLDELETEYDAFKDQLEEAATSRETTVRGQSC